MADGTRLQPTLIRFEPDMLEAVKARAAADDRTMSQTVRRAVRLYLEGEDRS